MIKRLYVMLIIILLLFPNTSKAELSEEAIQSLGKFLMMDYHTASDIKMKKPLSKAFFVKELNNDEIVITKEMIQSITSYSKQILNKFSPGRYRGILIINEINGIGCVVREANINNQNQIYWKDELQSLYKFARRPLLGNSGVVTIMDYENTELLVDIFKNVKRGTLPKKWQPKTEELNWYVSTVDLFMTILINRP